MDYIQTVGNFNPGYAKSGLYSSGHFAEWNVSKSELTSTVLTQIEHSRRSLSTSTGNNVTYNFLFRPPTGILNSTKPLLPKSELILTFDRAPADIALINKETIADDSLEGKVLPLKNVYLTAKYSSSPYLRNYFDSISANDISYKFDEISVYHKNLTQGDTIIRLPNIIGGNTPCYLFAGIIESDALSGHMEKSSTAFKRHGVTEFDLTLNGYSCLGFPLVNANDSPLNAYNKFLETTNRKFINSCPEQLLPSDFQQFHYLYSHKFEGEPTTTGWIGINLKLETAYAKNYTLGKSFFS